MVSRRCLQQKSNRHICLSIILILFILGIFGFSSVPNAQLIPLFSPPGLLPAQVYSPFFQIPTYQFFSPLNNLLGFAAGQVSNSPVASVLGSLVPLPPPSPLAVIAGATTVFVPPTATDLRVNVKVPGVTNIQLTSLVAPLTIFVYPSGYTPPAPVTIPPPLTTPAPATVITPVITTPTATAVPAVVSGAFFPFYFPII